VDGISRYTHLFIVKIIYFILPISSLLYNFLK